MGVNKVDVNGETLIDLTNDTVTPETLAEGVTAHNAQGERITGTKSGANVITNNLMGTSWKWNDTLSFPYVMEFDIDFVVNGVTYNKLKTSKSGAGIMSMSYGTDDGTTTRVYHGSWVALNSQNLTIDFIGGKDVDSAELREILDTNAKLLSMDLSFFQTKKDETLETESKEIPSAINELNSEVEAIQTYLGGTAITINFTITSEETLADIRTALEDVGANPEAVNFVTLSYFGVQRLFAVKFIDETINTQVRYMYRLLDLETLEQWSGADDRTDTITNIIKTSPLTTKEKTIYGAINELNAKIGNGGEGEDTPSFIGTWFVTDEPEIPTKDLPIEFTSNGTEYSAIGFTSQGSSSWGINALSYFRGDEGYYDIAYVNNPNGNYGITHGWRGEGYRYLTVTKEPTDKDTIKWLGNNTDAPKVEFEEDTFNGFEMPQIRFTSATGSTENETPMLYVDSNNPLKLTVEIVGGGALQVGDQLQVCRRKRFGGSQANGFKRRYKLQRFAEYVITDEDLDKKYLTVEVACEYGNEDKMLHHSHRGLFHDGMAQGLAPLYLRIRRPKGDMQANDSGQTVDADFSNIVTIWKHSIRGTQSIRIQ